MTDKYIRRDGGGNITGVSLGPQDGYLEKISEDHPDMVDYLVGGAARDAWGEVKTKAQDMVADLESSVTKASAKTAATPFKTQFQAASTLVEVESVRLAAIAAIEAL